MTQTLESVLDGFAAVLAGHPRTYTKHQAFDDKQSFLMLADAYEEFGLPQVADYLRHIECMALESDNTVPHVWSDGFAYTAKIHGTQVGILDRLNNDIDHALRRIGR